jgi:hypothetical protein
MREAKILVAGRFRELADSHGRREMLQCLIGFHDGFWLGMEFGDYLINCCVNRN